MGDDFHGWRLKFWPLYGLRLISFQYCHQKFFFLWLNISRLSVNICRFIRLKANFFSRFTTLCKYINDYNNNNDNDDKLKKSLLFGTYIKRFFSIKTKE